MMQTVQLSIADCQYAAALREALSRSCAWQVEAVERPDLSQHCALVLDEQAFARLPLPLSNPERIVLITQKETQAFGQAWDAGIVSVVSEDDPLSTVLLAIMAAALRVANAHIPQDLSAITRSSSTNAAPIAPTHRHRAPKRRKIQ
jgi:hypothetical protein